MAISPRLVAKWRICWFLCLKVHRHLVSNLGLDNFFIIKPFFWFIMFITQNTLSMFICGWSFTVWVCSIPGGGHNCIGFAWPSLGRRKATGVALWEVLEASLISNRASARQTHRWPGPGPSARVVAPPGQHSLEGEKKTPVQQQLEQKSENIWEK